MYDCRQREVDEQRDSARRATTEAQELRGRLQAAADDLAASRAACKQAEQQTALVSMPTNRLLACVPCCFQHPQPQRSQPVRRHHQLWRCLLLPTCHGYVLKTLLFTQAEKRAARAEAAAGDAHFAAAKARSEAHLTPHSSAALASQAAQLRGALEAAAARAEEADRNARCGLDWQGHGVTPPASCFSPAV